MQGQFPVVPPAVSMKAEIKFAPDWQTELKNICFLIGFDRIYIILVYPDRVELVHVFTGLPGYLHHSGAMVSMLV